ncbi:hypothetical protein BT96DRAFT_946426 [Gymnopus androsaceus JB14]|uniref:Uncharacterized protein n=1 Tax=Gymnopus androsaceus JB14 TaxID=1447944 RepID=A0A6A4GX65_9AGAR|nr:hypothetical protein BT96DRAFT_946426 [Gymnopus androsaceus JB14]
MSISLHTLIESVSWKHVYTPKAGIISSTPPNPSTILFSDHGPLPVTIKCKIALATLTSGSRPMDPLFIPRISIIPKQESSQVPILNMKAHPNPRKVPQLEEGMKAYAIKQSQIQRGLREKFLKAWSVSLNQEECFKAEEEANDRATREELGLDGRDDDDEEDLEGDETGNDGGDVEAPDKVEEDGEEQAEEADSFGFA